MMVSTIPSLTVLRPLSLTALGPLDEDGFYTAARQGPLPSWIFQGLPDETGSSVTRRVQREAELKQIFRERFGARYGPLSPRTAGCWKRHLRNEAFLFVCQGYAITQAVFLGFAGDLSNVSILRESSD